MTDDLMGDNGPAEAMVRRAVEAEREALLKLIRTVFRNRAWSARQAGFKGLAERTEDDLAAIEDAIRRRGE